VPPDDVTRLLLRVRRRRLQLDAVIALAAAAGAFAVAYLTGAIAIAAVSAAVVAAAVLWTRRRYWTLAHAARAVERVHPDARNILVTAEELRRHPERASAWMGARVAADAARVAQAVRVGRVVPAARTLSLCVAALAGAIGIVLVTRSPESSQAVVETTRRVVDTFLGRSDNRLTVAIHPPEYSRLREIRLTDPERIEALEGSRLVFSSRGADAVVRFGGRTAGTLRAGTPVTVTAYESGYFAIEPRDASAPRRLIAFAVRHDGAPSVTIDQPAKDLLLSNAERTIPVHVSAADDLELSALELRYTKLSGGGETFEFQEGTLPLRVTRTSGREWRADAELALRALNLQPGESVIYRAVARDRRSGDAAVGTSDTFFVEIAGPGQVALEGVEMPPQEERYALSQQMIVLKIERLKARQGTMAREAVAEEAALLAAEQRTVRANFVFLLGGHVEDEEVEAEQSHEIAEGRLQNTARREINRAIGDMTRAEQGLVAGDTTIALPPAKAAVESLQRAFGKSRYLLRTLPVRSRIDPSRRLTGTLAGAESWNRRMAERAPRPGEAARRVLGELAALSRQLANGDTIAPQAVEQLAESALAVDPSAASWQGIAREILALRDAGQRRAQAGPQLQTLIARVAAEASAGLVPQTPLARPLSPLQRAWERGPSR
jgi:hypothetical protein